VLLLHALGDQPELTEETTMTATVARRVLTAEDDPVVNSNLRLVLEDAGFSVCADARNGLEAVDLAHRLEPDVVLLGMGLPRLDGVEATRRIRANRDVPIVALVGRSDELAEEAVAAGAASCLHKPFTPSQVVRAVVDALAAHDPRVEGLRAESRSAIAWLVSVLGYPEGWADELERRSFARGRIWRLTATPADDDDPDLGRGETS
jgi:CheY-like chemotaxis protein